MHTEIDFQNADGRLMPGMYVTATVPESGQKDVLTVPLEAVDMKDTEHGTVLLLNSKNVLEERNVTLGMQGSTRVEIASGLNEGDQVVVGSRNEFRNGMKVQPKPIEIGSTPAGGK
jgi:multidrug efflux pump subunit AcrA (membrane-fusion protein)